MRKLYIIPLRLLLSPFVIITGGLLGMYGMFAFCLRWIFKDESLHQFMNQNFEYDR